MTNLLDIPAVSVILPVYNAEDTVEQSVRSILSQTFRDFELIIIDDGSTDKSAEIINRIDDSRIIFLQQRNIGLAATLNKAISLARAALVARQDNDDISYPQRLEKQVAFLKQHSDVVLLGTAARIVDNNMRDTGRSHRHPPEPGRLLYALLFDYPFVHSSVMFRKSACLAAGGYLTDSSVFEDYDLWSRMAAQGKVANLPDVLLDYRESPAGMSRSTSDYAERVARTATRNVTALLAKTDPKMIRDFIGGKLGRQVYKRMLDQLSDEAGRRFGLDGKTLAGLKSQQYALYCRKLYNQQLHDENSGAFTKLRARVLRYLLFRKQNWK